jgi:exoribonuclease R
VPQTFAEIRAEFELPDGFPPEALTEAEQAAAQAGQRPGDLPDETGIPLVTIDPPGALDLDQALYLEPRPGGGFRVRYAIADLAAFVQPGRALDAAAMARGQTLYLPDGNVPLHPPSLSEAAASLHPGAVRPAALWTIDTDADGEPTSVDVRRALVRSVARFDYVGVQATFTQGNSHPSVAALAQLGPLRRKLAVQRGAIELQLPEQEVSPDGNGGWAISLRPRSDIDAWNAEISLLTGMCAAQLMLSAGVGILRTLPAADADAAGWLRKSALALGVDWPSGASVAEVLAGLDPKQPESLALFSDSTRLLRGAGYTAFDGEPPADPGHAGIGGPYAHVTAPIRRLVDRFGAEVCLAVSAEREIPPWARAALPGLPEVMSASDSVAAKVERACLDQAEAWLLADQIGKEFEAVVLRVDEGKAEVLLADPPILAKCAGDGFPEGGRTTIRLVNVDVDGRAVSFEKS